MPSTVMATATVIDSGSPEQPPLTVTEVLNLPKLNHVHPSLLSLSTHSTLLSNLQTLSPSEISTYTLSLLSQIFLSSHKPLSSLLSSLLSSYVSFFLSSQVPRNETSRKTINLFSTLVCHVDVKELELIVESILLNLSKLVDFEDAQILELLPGCFGVILRESGIDTMNLLMDRVIESEWSKGVLVKMVTIVKELLGLGFVDKVRGREILVKVFKGMGGVDLQDVPSLAYQLLVLGSKGFNKREVIDGVIRFFGFELWSKRRSGSWNSIVRQVEGTVLLHVNFAVKQDPSLGQEVIELVKLDSKIVNHFAVAMLFSVAKVKRFSESSMGVLRSALVNAYHDFIFAKDCKWLSDDVKEEYLKNAQLLEKAILRAANESNCGREHIIPVILHFSFLLLESQEESISEDLYKSNNLLGSEELSFQMIKTVFEDHEMARNEIIENCKFRILSLKPEQSIRVIRLIGSLIQRYPYPMLKYVSHLKELLDYFTYMHGKVASDLVAAIVPIIKCNRDLQDYSILVIRKAMFRQEETIRLAATNAIISVLLAEKQSHANGSLLFQDSSSQASCSQQAEISYARSGVLFHELSGLMQRCLYQQAKVKEVLYCGLLRLFLLDPAGGGAVLDFLMPQFLNIFKKDVDLKLGISQCIKTENSKVSIEEPLSCFLSCASWIALLLPQGKLKRPGSTWGFADFSLSQENEDRRDQSSESFINDLLKIRKFLKESTVDDILSNNTSVEEEKRKWIALFLLEIVEVVMNAITAELPKVVDMKKVELEKELIELANLHETLEKEMLTKQSGEIKSGTPRQSAFGMPINGALVPKRAYQERSCFLATSGLYQLMQTSLKLYNSECSNDVSASQKQSHLSTGKMLKCFKLISFVLNYLLHLLKSYPAERREDPLNVLIYGEVTKLGPPLLKFISLFRLLPNLVPNLKKKETVGRTNCENPKELLRVALLCLKELTIINLQYLKLTALFDDMLLSTTLEHGQSDIDYPEASDDEDPWIRSSCMFIAKILEPLLSELLSESSFLEVEILCDMILSIGESLPWKWRNSIGAWCIRLCKNNGIRNPKAAKSLAALAICLSSSPGDLVVAQDMATEILKILGSETIHPSETSEVYPLINKSTRNAVSSCILQLTEAVIADMDWAVKKLKLFKRMTQRSADQSQDDEYGSRLAFENNLHVRAEAIVKILSSLVLMRLQDPQAENLLRVITKFYKHLAQMSRLNIAPKGFRQALPSLHFQKLVERTCKQLTIPLYNFIAERQLEQQENGNKKGIINKIKRENKCIPDLIFQIEDYERHLIQLSKVSKVNLLRHAKRSICRDFRIVDPVPEEEVEDGTNRQGSHDNTNENRLSDDNEEGQRDDGDEADNVALSPHSDRSLASKENESESDGENGDPISRCKRMKKDIVVGDSDDD